MTLNFVDKIFCIGGDGTEVPTVQMYRHGFIISGNAEPTWQDIILKGVTALTLVNAKAESLEYLKLFGDTEQLPETYLDTVTLSGGCEQRSILPEAYQQLEYIETVNQAYIDTGIVPTINSKARIKFSPSLTTVTGYFGSRQDTYRFCCTTFSSGANFSVGISNNTWCDNRTNLVIGNVYDVTFGNGFAVVNGVRYNETPVTSFSTITSFTLGYVRSGTPFSTAKYYICQLWDNDVLVFNGIPAKRKSDDVCGLYDTVTNTFIPKTNELGRIDGGLDVTVPTPDTPMDIVCNNGVIKVDSQGNIYTQGTQEVVTDSLGNTANAERLLAVGDYKDTQEVLTGTVSRNIGIKVFDGTENWTYSSTYSRFNISINDMKASSAGARTLPLLCNNYQCIDDGRIIENVPDNSIYTGGSVDLYIKTTQYNNTSDWQAFLATQYNAGTPVIIVYPTSSATTSTVTPQLLLKSPVTQTAGSISNLPIAITESAKTVPTPQQPLQINCNNGVVKVSPNLFDKTTIVNGYRLTNSLSDNCVYGGGYDFVAAEGQFTSALIPVTVGKTYTKNSPIGDAYHRLKTYDSNKIAVRMSNMNTITIGSGEAYIAFCGYTNELNTTQLEQGSTATPYMPYGQIYVDGTTETVGIAGDNLLDTTNIITGQRLSNVLGLTYGGYSGGTSDFARDTSYYVSNLIPVEVGKTYIKNSPSADAYHRFKVYDSNRVGVRITNDNSITIQSGEAYIAFCGAQTELTTAYCGEATDAATAENLFKVGTYQDVQSVLDGGVTRNVGIKVFDGTEDWGLSSGYFILTDFNFPIPNDGGYCTHFRTVSNSRTLGNLDDVMRFGYTAGNSNTLFVKSTRFSGVPQFKQYLADQYNTGSPVIVVYPLATPTTETVTAQPMNIQAGTNIVEITQASMDDLELEVKYKAGVSVTITEIENAQLDDNVEVTING